MTVGRMDNVSVHKVIRNGIDVVSLWSPWWYKLLDGADFVITEGEVDRIAGFTTMVFYVDRGFVEQSSVMDIAVALEFAAQQCVRNCDIRAIRLSEARPRASDNLVALAFALEINSDMAKKFDSINSIDWNLRTSTVIDSSHSGYYGTEEKPEMYKGAFVPGDFGFPDGLKAERYLDMLLERKESEERDMLEEMAKQEAEDKENHTEQLEQSSDEQENSGSGESSSQENSGSGESSSHSDSAKRANNGDSRHLDAEDGQTHEETSKDSENGVYGDSGLSQQKDSHDNDSRGEHPLEGNSYTRQLPGTPEDQSLDENTSQSRFGPGMVTRLNSASPEQGTSGHQQLTIPRQPTTTDVTGKSEDEQKSILKEVAQSMQDNSGLDTPGGAVTNPTNEFSQWSEKKLHKPKVSWKKSLNRILDGRMNTAQMYGQTDMSYGKPNPNQKKDMPIMMGLIAYPPNVMVVIDASPSMQSYKNTVMSEFTGFLRTFFGKYGVSATMVIADSGVKYVEDTNNPRSVLSKASRTYHGNSYDFGETLYKISRKGVTYKGRRYTKPDILVIFTDCAFQWYLPDSGRLPQSYPLTVIASVKPYSMAKSILPKWVKSGRNFVEMN